MHVLFYFRKSANSHTGTIYCRITVDGVRPTPFSTYVKTEKNLWNSDTQLIVSATEEAQKDNETIRQIRLALKEIYNQLLTAGRTVSAETIKQEYTSRTTASITFVALTEKLIERKIQEKKTHNTIRKLRSWQNKITRFFTEQKLLFLTPELFTPRISQEFYEWNQRHGSGKTHSAKILAFCKEILDYAVRLELVSANPLRSIQFQSSERKETPILEWDCRLPRFQTELR